jgi:hypothetical protein
LKALLENYFKLSIIFLKNLFEKNPKSKYSFLAFNQLYASLLAKDYFTNLLYSIWVAFFQTIIECVSQSLFYKLLFYYFKKNRVQTLFSFMQANPFDKSMKPFENLAPILKTSFLAVLNHCIDF